MATLQGAIESLDESPVSLARSFTSHGFGTLNGTARGRRASRVQKAGALPVVLAGGGSGLAKSETQRNDATPRYGFICHPAGCPLAAASPERYTLDDCQPAGWPLRQTLRPGRAGDPRGDRRGQTVPLESAVDFE